MNRKKLWKTINTYLRWPWYFLFLLIGMDICIYATEPKALWITGIFTVGYLFLLLLLEMRKNRTISRQLAEYGVYFSNVQRKMLLDLKIPYAMLSQAGVILWANDEFRRVTGMYSKHFYNIEQFFPIITKQEIEDCDDEKDLFYEIDGMQFRLQMKKVVLEEQEEGNNDGRGEVVALYLYDETEMRRLARENDERSLAIGMIYIDNYEDALEGINEVNGSLLPALVERKINQYMRGVDAVVKKTEKDKFMIAFQNKYLSVMKSDNFRIMEDVRSLHIGNKVNITLSIGISICDEKNYSFITAYDAAKAAINRALERGGDQVVVYGDKTAKNNDNEGYTYYGGKNEAVAKNSKVRSRVKAEAICEQIRSAENVLIMGHKNCDADSFGAAIGMYRIVKYYTDRVNIVLNDVQKLKTVSMLYEQYRASKSFEEGMIINNADAIKKTDKSTLVIVVDVNSEARTECPDILPLAGSIVVVDHHRETTPINNAKVTYSETYASSACELITEMIQHIEETGKRNQAEKRLEFGMYDADMLYSGILLDTNSFITKTGVRTFEAVTYLKRKGADILRVRKCFRKDKNSVYEMARVINNAEIFMDIFSFAINDCETTEENLTEMGAQIANNLLDVENIKASFVFTMYNGVVYVSARAIDEVNVELIMNRCGGGGHLNIAGAQFHDTTIDDAVALVKNKIVEMKEKGEI